MCTIVHPIETYPIVKSSLLRSFPPKISCRKLSQLGETIYFKKQLIVPKKVDGAGFLKRFFANPTPDSSFSDNSDAGSCV